jgi:hypothetical protein
MSRHLKRLALITIWSLALVVLVVPLTAQAAAAPTASNGGSSGMTPSQKAATAEGLAFTATVQALTPYVVRESDGTLSLAAPAAVINRLPSKYVGELTLGLGVLNAKVAAGDLRTTAAGSVFDPRSDSLMLQGGWSGHGWAWWGEYWCLSHNDIVYMNNGWWWDIGAGGIAVIAALTGWVGAALGIVYIYKGWMTAFDYGNGSCLNYSRISGPMWVTPQ